MTEAEKNWQEFVDTGSIEKFLQYKKLKEEEANKSKEDETRK